MNFRLSNYSYLSFPGAPRDQRRPDFGKNQQLFVFGMTNDTMEDREKVQETINQLDMELDFVMITEYFDESLVMLQDIMCWSMDDVVYLKKNFR